MVIENSLSTAKRGTPKIQMAQVMNKLVPQGDTIMETLTGTSEIRSNYVELNPRGVVDGKVRITEAHKDVMKPPKNSKYVSNDPVTYRVDRDKTFIYKTYEEHMDEAIKRQELEARLQMFIDHCQENLSDFQRSKLGISDFYKFVGEQTMGDQ